MCIFVPQIPKKTARNVRGYHLQLSTLLLAVADFSTWKKIGKVEKSICSSIHQFSLILCHTSFMAWRVFYYSFLKGVVLVTGLPDYFKVGKPFDSYCYSYCTRTVLA